MHVKILNSKQGTCREGIPKRTGTLFKFLTVLEQSRLWEFNSFSPTKESWELVQLFLENIPQRKEHRGSRDSTKAVLATNRLEAVFLLCRAGWLWNKLTVVSDTFQWTWEVPKVQHHVSPFSSHLFQPRLSVKTCWLHGFSWVLTPAKFQITCILSCEVH